MSLVCEDLHFNSNADPKINRKKKHFTVISCNHSYKMRHDNFKYFIIASDYHYNVKQARFHLNLHIFNFIVPGTCRIES